MATSVAASSPRASVCPGRRFWMTALGAVPDQSDQRLPVGGGPQVADDRALVAVERLEHR